MRWLDLIAARRSTSHKATQGREDLLRLTISEIPDHSPWLCQFCACDQTEPHSVWNRWQRILTPRQTGCRERVGGQGRGVIFSDTDLLSPEMPSGLNFPLSMVLCWHLDPKSSTYKVRDISCLNHSTHPDNVGKCLVFHIFASVDGFHSDMFAN